MELNREKMAWAAGFFDGEGSTFVTKKSGSTSISLEVSQLDKEVLLKFKNIVGVGRISEYNKKSCSTGKIFRYNLSNFEECQYSICLMWDQLGTLKRNQAVDALKAYLSYVNRKVCKEGHTLTYENLYVLRSGTRTGCRLCKQKTYGGNQWK